MDITEEKVHKIISQLKKRDEKITIRKIRIGLGNKGSYTTIGKYMDSYPENIRQYPSEYLNLRHNIKVLDKTLCEIFMSCERLEEILGKKLRRKK